MIKSLGLKGVRRVQRYRARHGPYGAIFIYHRVADPVADPWNMSVSPENFQAHLDILRTYATPKTMRDLVGDLGGKGTAKPNVSVTFDDGYVDNLKTALPIMETCDFPGTFFIVSGAIGKPDAFWWDVLTTVFLEQIQLPDTLKIELPGASYHSDLTGGAHYSAQDRARAAVWKADREKPQNIRQKAFLDVWGFILSLPAQDKSQAVAQLAQWAGLVPDPHCQARPMDHAELNTLAKSGLVEIGGHTVTHPDLSQASASDGFDEIAKGRQDLIEMVGGSVDSFAYPFGRYSEQTALQTQQAGFSFAAWSRSGLATPTSNPFTLPRIPVPNLDADAFERLVRDVLGPSKQNS